MPGPLDVLGGSGAATFVSASVTGQPNPVRITTADTLVDVRVGTRIEDCNCHRDPDSGFDFDVYAAVIGLDTAPDEPVVTLAKTLAGRNDHAKVAFGTEGGLFQTIAGVPTVVIGPGSIDQAHKADEWIAVSELEKCGSFVERVIATCR